MARLRFFIFTTAVCLLLLACGNDDVHSPDGDSDVADGDTDSSEVDGDGELEEFLPYEQKFSCQPRDCRDGFANAPNCVLPDIDRMQAGLIYNICSDDSDCDDGQKCIYATPEWICVPVSYPNWLGLYEWTDRCAFGEIETPQVECPVVGAWKSGGRAWWLERCVDATTSRLCNSDGCTDSLALQSSTMVASATCPALNATFVLILNQNDWPQTYEVYRHGPAGLKLQGEVSSQIYYYIENHPGGSLVCNGEGELILATPSRLMRYAEGTFNRFLPIEAVQEMVQSDLYGSFDSVRFDLDNPQKLYIGIASSYQANMLTYDLDGGFVDIQQVSMDNWQIRVLPSGRGDWLIASGTQVYRLNDESGPLPWFVQSTNEWLVGFDADGGILTRTISRLFRRDTSENALPVAVDAGLPFPAEYKYYVPIIRSFTHQVFDNVDTMDILMQYRPTDNSGNANPPDGGMDEGWE